MDTTVRWQEQGPARVLISQPGPGFARLFGLPFVAAGGYFLRFLLGGILHPSEMTIFGWILLPFMTAVFLVPGWMLLTLRKRVTLDATAREAFEEFDFLVYTHTKRTPITSAAHVMLRYEKGSDRSVKGPLTTSVSSSFWTHVYLTFGDNKILLALFGGNEKPAALAFSEKVAKFFGIDVQDKCFEHGEIAAGGVVVDRLGPDEADPEEAD